MCDIFNANDVLFSTASLLHLCCVSVDRYVAVTDPLNYERRMSRTRAAVMLAAVWIASALLSHLPIHLGWYAANVEPSGESTTNYTVETTPNAGVEEVSNEGECVFEVNVVFGVVSSTVSFWTPAVIIVVAYGKIFSEARRQESRLRSLSSLHTAASRRCHSGVGASEKLVGVVSSPESLDQPGNSLECPRISPTPSLLKSQGQRRKVQRDNKAARTLGVVVGAFLCCWLPFFLWYLTVTLCGPHRCPTPNSVALLLFWTGYANSAFNPVIYACFNRDFRNAFRRLLRCSGDAGAQRRRSSCPGRTSPSTTSIWQCCPCSDRADCDQNSSETTNY